MKDKDKKKKDKKNVLPTCNENVYVDRNKVKEGLGLSDKARIIME